MTEKELHRLSRQDLLQLLLAQSKEVSRQRAAIEELKSNAEKDHELIDRLKGKLDDKDASLETLKHRLDEKDETIAHLKRRLDAKDETMNKLKADHEDMAGTVEFLRSRLDEKDAAKVAVLSTTHLKDLGNDVIGRWITIAGVVFRVVGVYHGDENDFQSNLYIPYSTYKGIFDPSDKISSIIMTFRGVNNIKESDEFEGGSVGESPEAGAEPCVRLARREGDGHAVVHRPHLVAGLCGQDGEVRAVLFFAVKPCEEQKTVVRIAEAVSCLVRIPFVKPAGRDDAAPAAP